MQKIHCPFSYNVLYKIFSLHFGQRFILFFDLYEILCVFYEKNSRFASLVRPSKIWYSLEAVYTKRLLKYSENCIWYICFKPEFPIDLVSPKMFYVLLRTFQKIVTLQKILFFLIEIFTQKFELCKIFFFENLNFLNSVFPKVLGPTCKAKQVPGPKLFWNQKMPSFELVWH